MKQLFASARETLRPVLPRRLRGDIPIVPVVRLTGIIGISTPLRPGLMLASLARQLERARELIADLLDDGPLAEDRSPEISPHRARAIPRKSTALRLAPPTSAPLTLATAISSAAFDGLTEPP